MRNKSIIFLPAVIFLLLAAGRPVKMKRPRLLFKTSDTVPIDVDYHKIGQMWMRITNFSMIGDDSYTNRTPSAEWPGGSGNSYLYRGSLWLTGTRNGVRATSTHEDKEFTPLSLVEKESFLNGLAEHSVAKFTDAIKTSEDHIPIGFEVTQHTYAYGVSFADDFIIYKYYLKNVGVDTTGDGVVDDTSAITGVHFTFRMDGDISKLSTWDTEADFVNRDDHAMCLTGSWDELKLFPYMEWQFEKDTTLWDQINAYQGDSTLTIMFDGDNRSYPSEVDTSLIPKSSYLYEHPDDDFGNPNPRGEYQSPGVLAMQMIHTDPYLKPKSYTTSYIGQNFTGDAAMWSNAIGKTTFDKLFKLPPFQGGGVNEGDYRAITTFGPLDTLAYGDSVEIIFAIGVGAEPVHAGAYSFLKLVQDMEVAKILVQDDFQIDTDEFAPSAEIEMGAVFDENNDFTGALIEWDPAASIANANFTQFVLRKAVTRDASGNFIWDTLQVYSLADVEAILDTVTNNKIGYFDTDVMFGYDYTYELVTESYSQKYFKVTVATQDYITATGKSQVSVLDDIRVVPNPYKGSAPWNNPEPANEAPRHWKDRLFFINLPSDAVVRIFTLDGDHVATIRPTDLRNIENAPETNQATAEWDLVSRSNRDVAPGIYIYHVTSSLGEKVGKFTILR